MRPILLMEIKKAYKNKLFLLSMLTASLIALYAAVFSIISYHKYVNADSASAALTGYALNPELPGITLFTNWIGLAAPLWTSQSSWNCSSSTTWNLSPAPKNLIRQPRWAGRCSISASCSPNWNGKASRCVCRTLFIPGVPRATI